MSDADFSALATSWHDFYLTAGARGRHADRAVVRRHLDQPGRVHERRGHRNPSPG
jgi:hypothetical protein